MDELYLVGPCSMLCKTFLKVKDFSLKISRKILDKIFYENVGFKTNFPWRLFTNYVTIHRVWKRLSLANLNHINSSYKISLLHVLCRNIVLMLLQNTFNSGFSEESYQTRW